MTSVRTHHPEYVVYKDDWEMCRDVYAGERRVKAKGEKYLPPTAGMKADGMGLNQLGRNAYDAYKNRALFPNDFRGAVETMMGLLHHKPAEIELPSRLEPLLDTATLREESLQLLLQRINEQQLIAGRCGLMLDVAAGADLPYIAFYEAERIINWDDGSRDLVLQNLNLVVLNETEYVREDFTWKTDEKYRVLVLGEAEANESRGVYRVAVLTEDMAWDESSAIVPSIRGRTLEEIPFVFVNAQDVVPEPGIPPLLGLAHLSIAMYRGEADYRQSLFMQGQDTLVVKGATDPDQVFRTGANASINVPSNGDAKFIGVNSGGLSEQRLALENDRKTAAAMGSSLLSETNRERESGEALKTRVTARTATLKRVAVAGGFALEQILKKAAIWVGADPDQVIVKPNVDFQAEQLLGQELDLYTRAIGEGAPLSLKSLHENLVRARELSTMSFEEEMAQIALEKEQFGDVVGRNEPEEPDMGQDVEQDEPEVQN